jgi:Domain of unknown function (DUF1905)
VDPLQFDGTIRYWDPDRGAGLAVVDVPGELIPALGGLKQQRVGGTINAVAFTSNVMPAGAGRLALSVSKAMMRSAGAEVGQDVTVEISTVGRE